jgi:hypothetical protein
MIQTKDWLLIVNNNALRIIEGATKEDVTPWFSGDTHPIREGWYERQFTDGVFRHFWNGAYWSNRINGDPHWRQVGSYPVWRGLNKQYKQTPLQTLMVLADDYKESISAAMQKETRDNLEAHLKKLLDRLDNCKFVELL